MSNSNQVAVRYLKEVTWGTTPAATAGKTMRITGETLDDVKGTVESAEIIATRELRDKLQVSRQSEGGLSFEWTMATMDEWLEGALCGAWATDVLSNGQTAVSYTVEKHFTDLTNEFIAFKGLRVGGMTLEASLGEILKGTVNVMGLKGVPGATTVFTGAPVAAGTDAPMTILSLSMTEGGSPLTGITGFSLAIDNGLRGQMQAGDSNLFGIGLGGFRVSGSVQRYFTGQAGILTKYDGHTQSAMVVTLTAGSKSYAISIPAIRYDKAAVLAEGVNGDVLIKADFTAILDTVSGKMLSITRDLT